MSHQGPPSHIRSYDTIENECKRKITPQTTCPCLTIEEAQRKHIYLVSLHGVCLPELGT